jgi:hypothetical protein
MESIDGIQLEVVVVVFSAVVWASHSAAMQVGMRRVAVGTRKTYAPIHRHPFMLNAFHCPNFVFLLLVTSNSRLNHMSLGGHSRGRLHPTPCNCTGIQHTAIHCHTLCMACPLLRALSVKKPAVGGSLRLQFTRLGEVRRGSGLPSTTIARSQSTDLTLCNQPRRCARLTIGLMLSSSCYVQHAC